MYHEAQHLTRYSAQQAPESGWLAKLNLGFIARNGKTILAQRSHLGPLTVQRPFYPEGGVCHVYVLHPPGGVVAGDQLTLAISAATGSAALVTTPAAGKFYRSSGHLAQQSVDLHIASGATLEWLPQETIIYEGAQVSSKVKVQLAADARFIAWEILALGRPAANEGFNSGSVSMDWCIQRDDTVCYRERLKLDAQAFKACWGSNGLSACGTMFAYPATPEHLETVRAYIGDNSEQGVTLIEDLLICRALDARADRLRHHFQQIWHLLRQDIVQKPTSAPRIWET